MNSQNSREAIYAAFSFLIAAVLSLIVSFISSEKEATPVAYGLAAGFVVLVAVGALIEWARRSGDTKPDNGQQKRSGTTQPRPAPPPRTRRSVLAGGISGLVVSGLFFLTIGPGSHGTAAPHPSPTVTVTSDPAPTGGSGQLVSLHARPADGGAQFGDEVTLTVTADRQLPAGDTYWLMTQFLGGPNVVYKAEDKIPVTQGTTNYSLSIASSAVGSTREVYILQADSQATPTLAQNYAHQEPSWDGNRTSLPSGVVTVSNSVTVVKQTG